MRTRGDDLAAPVAIEIHRGDDDAAGEGGVIGKEPGEFMGVGAAPHPDVRAAARPRAGDDVGVPIAVDVRRGDVDAAGKRGIVGEEAGDLVTVHAAPDAHVRAATGPGPGDDVGAAVAIDVRGRDVDAAGKRGIVGEEAGDLEEGRAVPHAHPRRGPRARAGDDIGPAIARHVAGGDTHATRKRGVVGEDAPDLGQVGAVPHADMRAATRPCTRHDIELSVPVHVPERHAHAAGESGGIGDQRAFGAGGIEDPHGGRHRSGAAAGRQLLRRCRRWQQHTQSQGRPGAQTEVTHFGKSSRRPIRAWGGGKF
jgi:hypothetical protein